MLSRYQVIGRLMSLILVTGLLGPCGSRPSPLQVSEITPQPSTTISTNEQASLAITAIGTDLQFEWKADRGSISSPSMPAIVYTAPNSAGPDIVTVKVTSKGDSTIRSITFQVVEPTIPPPACPPANANGTVLPAVAISSITFVVNGAEGVADDSGSLQLSPGNRVGVKEVQICVDPFGGNGGTVYVEFDPVEPDPGTPQASKIVTDEVKGTRAVPVISGFTTIPGPDYTWTIDDNWQHFSVVTVHYPPKPTENDKCELGNPNICEIDDLMIVPIQ